MCSIESTVTLLRVVRVAETFRVRLGGRGPSARRRGCNVRTVLIPVFWPQAVTVHGRLAPAFLDRLGLSPRDKVLDLTDRVRCRNCDVRGRAVVSIKWAKSVG
jgi:hypothetical protein